MRPTLPPVLRKPIAAGCLAGLLFALLNSSVHGAQSPLKASAVLATGSVAPGLPDVTISSLGQPSISESGHVVLQATLSGSGVTTTNDRAIYLATPGLGLELILREGTPAPGTSHVFDAPSTYAVDPNGVVAFKARLVNAPINARDGVWSGTTSGLVLRELQGQAAPGAGSTFSNVFVTAVNGSASGSFVASMNKLNDGRDGIWVHGPAGLRKVALEGDTAPGVTQTFDAVALFSIDPQGNACFAGGLSDLRQGYWIEKPTPIPVILTGQSLPIGSGAHGQFSTVGRISANASSRVSFIGGVTGIGVNASNDKGIWTDRSGAFELIARTGDAAPGLASAVLTDFSNVLINESNQIAFVSRLSGGGFGTSTDMALYIDDSITGTHLVFHTGMPAPGTPTGVVFAYSLILDIGGFNAQGNLLVSAIVSGPGVTASNDTGYWLYTNGQLEFLAREGDDLEVAPGNWRTIARLFPIFPSTGADGLTAQFNGKGQLSFLVEFTDGSRGVFLAETAASVLPPSAPILFLPAATSGAVSISWSNPPDEAFFWVERRTGIGGNWQHLVTRDADVTTFVDEAVIPSTTYYYRVRAQNEAGSSAYSNVQSITVPNTPPPMPANLTAYPQSSTTIHLQWDDVSGETGYRISRFEAGMGSEIATLGQDAASFVDSTVTAAAGYQYFVAAFNASGFSAPAQVEVKATELSEVFFEDFDPQAAPWSAINGATVLNGGQGFPDSNVLWFGGASTRQASTIGLDVSTGGYLLFKLRGGNQSVDGQTYWDDAESGEDVVLEYAVDGDWTEMQAHSLNEAKAKTWREYVAQIPDAARTSSTQFRWRQVAHSGLGEDTWALDDIRIQATTIPIPATPAYAESYTLWATVVALQWGSSAFADAYVVERETIPGVWQLLGTFPNQGFPQMNDSGLVAETTYQYRIKAVNLVGASDYAYTTVSTWSHLVEWQYRNFGPFTETPDMMARDESGHTLTHRYAFNLDLNDAFSAHVPGFSTNGVPAMWFDQSGTRLQVEFVRRNPESNPRLDYIVQFSTDLSEWTDVLAPTSVEPIDWIWQRVRYRDPAIPGSHPRRFVRVKLLTQ